MRIDMIHRCAVVVASNTRLFSCTHTVAGVGSPLRQAVGLQAADVVAIRELGAARRVFLAISIDATVIRAPFTCM